MIKNELENIKKIKIHVRKLLEEKGLSLNSLSIQFGKNSSYLQKFVKESSPKRLDEEVRKKLARVLEVNEQELTDITLTPSPNHLNVPITENIVSIDIVDAVACCGCGIDNLEENVIGSWNLPLQEFKDITFTTPDNVKMLKVKGDSMETTLKDGDWVLVDISVKHPNSDGLFLLMLSTGISVKRLQGTISDEIIIKSDNPKYNDFNQKLVDIIILGKVIYTLTAEKVG